MCHHFLRESFLTLTDLIMNHTDTFKEHNFSSQIDVFRDFGNCEQTSRIKFV